MGEKSNTTDNTRVILQGAYSNTKQYREGVFGELLKEALGDCIEHNPWLNDQQASIVEKYMDNLKLNAGNIVEATLKNSEASVKELIRVSG